MRILITGGAGFIGSNITERLLSLGYEVTVLDDLSTGKMENLRSLTGHPGFTFHQGSILDLPLLRELIRERRIERICHQAARPSVARSIDDPLATHEVNITGTLNVLKAAHEAQCQRVTAASSSSIYGNTAVLPKREDMHYRPRSPYAASKVAGELYLQVFHAVYGLQTVGLRYFNVYGPRQDPNSHYAAVIPKFIRLALHGEPLPIEGDGGQTRDFTYIDDVVNANVLALTAPELRGESVNIGFGEQTSIRSLAETIIRLTSSSSKIECRDPRPGDVRDSLADISLAKNLLGYKPGCRLSDGLMPTIDWYRANLNQPSEVQESRRAR
ncbi:MAG: SDR family oxidoreductase [Nitrospirae bacterium]|nr:SDR family oxidoreductase [Nitrospirota bacterium]